MKVLVTGGGGFLGQNIVQRLQADGLDVVVLGRSKYPQLEEWKIPCIQGDVRDPEVCQKAVADVDAVFHVAARVGYWGPYSEYEEINVGGTTALLKAAQEAGVERFVYTSTPSVVIGPKGDLQGADETTAYPESYLSSYGPTKAEAERRVLAANSADMRTVALRPHFIYGPGDGQIAPRLVARSHEGRLVQVGDGTNKVDVAYIDNVVDAHCAAFAALEDPAAAAAGEAYFVGNSEPVPLWEFVAKVLEGFEAPSVKRTLSLKAAYALGYALEGVFKLMPAHKEPPLTRMAAITLGTSHWFSHAKAKRDFGWSPAVSTDEGLARTFAAARAT